MRKGEREQDTRDPPPSHIASHGIRRKESCTEESKVKSPRA